MIIEIDTTNWNKILLGKSYLYLSSEKMNSLHFRVCIYIFYIDTQFIRQ